MLHRHRFLLTCFLLLAACLHAAAGAQPHGHCAVHGWKAALAVHAATPPDAADPAPHAPDDHHAGCATCLAHAHAFTLPATPVLPPVPARAPRTQALPDAQPLPPGPQRWDFAVRDPPRRG